MTNTNDLGGIFQISNEISDSLEDIILSKIEPGAIVITDFDGTLFDGDVTFGQEGTYPGLMEILEKSDIRPIYPYHLPSSKEILEMYEKFPQYNVVYNIAIFAGFSVQKIIEVAEKAYQDIYHKYVNQRLLKLLKKVIDKEGQVIILTASPKLYLAGIQKENPQFQIIGVETKIIDDRVSPEPTIIPFGPGKAAIVQNLLKNGKNVVAGFGNRDNNDGPWLKLLNDNGKMAIVVEENFDWNLLNPL